MSPDGGTVGQWDSRKTYDLCFTLSQIFGTVGRWDSWTAGKHMICRLLCSKYLGQWDSGTQLKNIYSKVVSLYLCDIAYGPKWWDGGTVGQQENI